MVRSQIMFCGWYVRAIDGDLGQFSDISSIFVDLKLDAG